MADSHIASLRNALLGTVAAAAALAIVPGGGIHAENGAQTPTATSVSVAIVEPRDTTTWDEFSGRLEAVERVDVRSRVAGAVQEIHFREGALVKHSDLLVTIDPAPFKAEVERNEAQVAAAEARVGFTKSEVERARQLSGTPALSVRELDTRTNTYNEAVANLRAAKAALESARLNLGYTAVRAPVAGRVGRIEVTVGNLVEAGPGAPVLTRLVSVDPIYASFDADEDVVVRALATLPPKANAAGEIGQIPVEMSFAAQEGHWIRGSLQLIDNQVDASSGTVRVRAVFSNADGRLIPGQFAKVRMAQPKRGPALAVNERAIGTDQNKKFVLVVGDGNKTQYREITLGALADRLRIVTSGLAAGERIVVNGLQRVRPGDVVAPEPVAMDGMSNAQANIETGSTTAQQ